MRLEPATPTDLPSVQASYAEGRATQSARGTLVWPTFSDPDLIAEAASGRLLCVYDDRVFAGCFSVALEDHAVWGKRETGDHVYIHRIARAPSWSGQGFLATVLQWSRDYALSLNRVGLRLDTAAASTRLTGYYERFGFTLVDRTTIGADPNLPSHYHGTEIALMEMICSESSRTRV